MNSHVKSLNRREFKDFIGSYKNEPTLISSIQDKKISILDIKNRIDDASSKMSVSEEACILLGDTDAGKSTLANLLAGIPLKAISRPHHGFVIDLLNPDLENCCQLHIKHLQRRSTQKCYKPLMNTQTRGL